MIPILNTYRSKIKLSPSVSAGFDQEIGKIRLRTRPLALLLGPLTCWARSCIHLRGPSHTLGPGTLAAVRGDAVVSFS